MKTLLALCVIAFPVPAQTTAQNTKPPKPEPWYIIPDVSPPRPPAPPSPKPSRTTIIDGDRMYVVQFSKPTFMLKPDGTIVKVTEEQGPVSVRGLFVGGGDKVQTKKFTGPQVFIVEAVADGTTTLTWVKKGAIAEADVLQRIIETRKAPQPPPEPPIPTPPPVVIDPLQPIINSAFKVDTPADPAQKMLAARKWVAYYHTAAATCQFSNATNTDQLWTEIQAAENASGVNITELPVTRNPLKEEMKKLYPAGSSVNVILDKNTKDATAAIYNRFAALLEGAMK